MLLATLRIGFAAALCFAASAGAAVPGGLRGEAGPAAHSHRIVARDSTVYLDSERNVHVVEFGGRDIRITREGRYRDPKLSSDGRTFGMLVTSTIDIEGHDSLEVAEVLRIARKGREIRRIAPGGYIRAWGFANQDSAVAVYSGALHFAGFYVLYDIERGVELASAKDPVTDGSPDWVRALAP